MLHLHRIIPAGKTYSALIAEDPNVKFEYFTSENLSEPNSMLVDSIEEWFKNFNNSIEEYSVAKQWCKDYLNTNGWALLTDGDKDALIALDLSSDTDSVPYLMGKGYSLEQARETLLVAFSKDHIKNIEACSKRMNDEYLYFIIGKHLPLGEAASFFSLTQNLSAAYERQALKGTVDSPGMGVGFFDFIEDTPGTVYATVGLDSQGFLGNAGDGNMSPLREDLMKWFRYGVKV